jgi:hypothetical protein
VTNVLRLAGHAPPIALFLNAIPLHVDSAIRVATDIHSDLESIALQLLNVIQIQLLFNGRELSNRSIEKSGRFL